MKAKKSLLSLFSLPEKKIKTIWKIEKEGKIGFLVGTAHFFPHRLEKSLRHYIQQVETVCFEGPLDETSLNQVLAKGSQLGGSLTMLAALDAPTISKIRRSTGSLFQLPDALSLILPWAANVRDPLYVHFEELRPWMAFFKIWTYYLKERGWNYSVDLEALKIATQQGKKIVYLETIEEQIMGLEGIPSERFINFFKKIDHWEKWAQDHVHFYLQGNLEDLLAITQEFPSRCPAIVEKRDPVMFARLQKYFAAGKVMAFVGTPHIPGITNMFIATGYSVSQIGKAAA